MRLTSSQGSVLKNRNLEKNVYSVSTGSYTQILSEKDKERKSLIIQFKGDGDGTVLLKFDSEDTDDFAFRFNNADLISEFVELPSKYSGALYAKSESGSFDVLVVEA